MAMSHTEECCKIFAEKLEKVGDERVEREKRKFCSSIWKKRKKKAKSGKSERKENQVASSSGEAGVEAQRSIGGVPVEQATMTRSSRGSTTKRKAE